MALFKTESRIQIIGLFLLLGIAALIGKLWWLQIVKGDDYKKKIRGSGEVTVRIPSVRGEIRDKNGLVLVGNRASFSVDFMLDEMVKGYGAAFGKKNVPRARHIFTVGGVYKETQEPDVAKIVQETVLPRLEQLGLRENFSVKQLVKHFYTDKLVPFTYMEDIPFSDMAKISERDLGLPGVWTPQRPVREYPFGALAAHILGYVGQEKAVDEEEAKNYDYYQPDVDGKTNVELTMDKWLRGKPGKRRIKKNAKGVIEGDLKGDDPITGNDVYLTVDARIQAITEDAVRVVGRGAAVVVDPNSGNVLAMASVPSFDPNQFIPSVSTEDWNKLIKDDTDPMTNRAILSYAPGSTFKTITALAGLITGKGGNRYTCSGGYSYSGRYMHCWIGQKGGSHGTLDLEGGIKNSCNVFFFQYGNAAGVDAINKVANFVGIGQRTGIELSNEAAGILPGKDWFAVHNSRERWTEAHTANLSIGQGFVQASPLQMALVAGMFANGGTCYYPRLIDRVVDRAGQDVVDPDTGKLVAQGPRVRSSLETDLGLKPDQIEHIRHGMWRVVNDAGGTAPHAKLRYGGELAGKTGTAEFWRKGVKDNHTWFISFAPYQKPKYAICVFLQGAKGGGVTAGPIAGHIMEQLLQMDDGKLAANVRPLTPAKGSFAFINNVEYTKDNVPVVQTAANAQEAEKKRFVTKKSAADNDFVDVVDDETPPPTDDDSTDRDADHDHVVAAKPKMRESDDERGSTKTSASSNNSNGDTPLMKSMRKFFRRDNGGDNGPDDTEAQTRTLRKQQKAQQQRQLSASQQPAQPTPPPKRKKFLGLF